MNLSGLSFNALPPVHLPFRYFLSVPIFALACAFLLFNYGETMWLSRWHPATLALTHGFTLGILTMVMMGALLQILPVVAGISVPKVQPVATISHICMSIGTAALMLSFFYPIALLLWLSFIALLSGFSLFIGALVCAFIPTWQKSFKQGRTLVVIRLAILFFFITIALGLLLQLNRLGFSTLPFDKFFTNLHALLGGFGWMALLIIAVSFQVIPMFHVAPEFPKSIAKFLPKIIFVTLIILAASGWLGISLQPLIAFLLLLNGLYVSSVIWVISKRKRKIPDVTILYWLLASISLLLLVVMFLGADYIFAEPNSNQATLLFASAFIYFYVLSVIQGLMIKILPFLSYTHLQQRCLINFEAMQFLPHMHQFITKKQAYNLWWLHLLSGSLLLLTITVQSLYWSFALAMTAEFLWLFYLMLQTVLLYKKVSKKIAPLIISSH